MTNANICAANDTVEVAIDMLKIRILSKSTGNKGAGSPDSRRTRVTPEAIPVAISTAPSPALSRANVSAPNTVQPIIAALSKAAIQSRA